MTEHIRFAFCARHDRGFDDPFSRFFGKLVRPAPPVSPPGSGSHRKCDGSYASFIIGEDGAGRPTRHACDPDALSDYFGANRGVPHYLTPVYFSRDVLRRYYDEPTKYTIDDGQLRCGGLWSVSIDTNHPDHVMVFLGDLGRDLPETHRDYWRAFNILPTGEMSEAALRRSFLGQWVGPEALDLRFRSLYQRFNQRWEEGHGSHLHKPLHRDNLHILDRVRVPPDQSLLEFEHQIASLAKLLVDSLNTRAIDKQLSSSDKREASIAKLGRWLDERDYAHADRDVSFLRRLQMPRPEATVAHGQGSDSDDVMTTADRKSHHSSERHAR